MTSKQYDETEPFFRNEFNKYAEICRASGINVNTLYNWLPDTFARYGNLKNKIKLINRLDFSDELRTKVLLNKAGFGTKSEELALASRELEVCRVKLFTFLASTKDPYFFIFSPLYKFGRGEKYKICPYQKDIFTGVQNTSIMIAEDYAMFKINSYIYNHFNS